MITCRAFLIEFWHACGNKSCSMMWITNELRLAHWGCYAAFVRNLFHSTHKSGEAWEAQQIKNWIEFKLDRMRVYISSRWRRHTEFTYNNKRSNWRLKIFVFVSPTSHPALISSVHWEWNICLNSKMAGTKRKKHKKYSRTYKRHVSGNISHHC